MTEPRFVQGVSVPRSGHHLLARMLGNYFAGRWRYYDLYAEGHFFNRPPRGTTFAKHHDNWLNQGRLFRVRFPVRFRKSGAFLVQVREPYAAFISAWELRCRERPKAPATRDAWLHYVRRQTDYVAKFLRKWVEPEAPPGVRLILTYDQLTEQPEAALDAAIRFCAPGEQPDPDRLSHIVRHQGVAREREVAHFRYHDPALAEELQERLGDTGRLNRLADARNLDTLRALTIQVEA
ncbi:MAG: hypothetical protein ACFE0O_00565 [Opitutales bacterium]